MELVVEGTVYDGSRLFKVDPMAYGPWVPQSADPPGEIVEYKMNL